MINSLSKSFIYLFDKNQISLDITIFSIFLLLIPFALITGPAIPDILISCIALYFLVISIVKRTWDYYRNYFCYIFLFFIFVLWFSSIFSDLPYKSLLNEGSVFYFRYIFFILGVWYLIDQNKYLTKLLLYVIFLCIFIVLVDGFYQYFFRENIFGFKPYSDDRLTGLFNDEPIIGRYIVHFTIFSFVLIYDNFKVSKKSSILLIIYLTSVSIFTFLTGERAPFFYIIFFSIMIAFFSPGYYFYKIVGAVFTFTLIALLLIFNPSLKTRMVDFTISQIQSTHLSYLPYTPDHEMNYISGLKMFMDKPLFGVGTNLFKYKCDLDEYRYRWCQSHPHNYYIQLLAENGIFGFLFLSSFYFFLLFKVIKQAYYRLFKQIEYIPFKYFLIFISLFIFWWPLIPHMSFYNNWNNIMIVLPVAFLLRYLYSVKKNNNNFNIL